MERQRVDPVSRLDRLDPPREQPDEVRGIAAGPGEADADALRHAVDAVGDQLDPARAEPRQRQRARQFGDEAPEPMADRLGGGDRLGEAPARDDHARRHHRIERLGREPQRAIELERQRHAEAADQRRARHRGERADPIDAEPAQQLDRRGIDAQRHGGEGRDRLGVVAGRANQYFVVPAKAGTPLLLA